jgi:hypothetical protein
VDFMRVSTCSLRGFWSFLQVGERTKTADEVEEAELARLQKLEKQRQMRMSGDDASGPGAVEEDQIRGGYAQRRAKRQKREEDEEVAGVHVAHRIYPLSTL